MLYKEEYAYAIQRRVRIAQKSEILSESAERYACLLGLKWIGPILVMGIFGIIKIISYPMREVSLSPLHHFWSHKAQ